MLTVTRHILVSAPKEHVSEYLRDASRLADYEQKVDQCKVTYPDGETALAEVSGRYFGVPWSGSFKMVYTGDGGYQSEMLKGPFRKGLGGFELTKVAGGTRVMHLESYHLPLALKVLRPILRRWLVRSMDLELGIIKEGAEGLHRRRLLEDIDRDVQLDSR